MANDPAGAATFGSRTGRRFASSRHGATGNFVDTVRRVVSVDELRGVMDGVTRDLGFRYFAIIHHVDLNDPRTGIININDYPSAWSERVIAGRYYVDDPVVHACLRTNAAFAWSELGDLLPLRERQRDILAAAAREGLADGISIPACIPGEPTGSCSFAGGRRALDRSRVLPLAQFFGAFAFAAARRLVSGGSLALPGRRRLTPRQRECILLVGEGKTDWEIAAILGLSRVTVKHYLDDARAAYGVVSRTQLVLHALLEGEISLLDFARSQYVHLDG